mgnify:CR=1 FL=1
MGRVKSKTYGQPIGVLKFFPYQAKAVLILESGVDADDDGNKIVKAGTPFPSNDENCEGYVLEDVDVTNGDAPGAVVFEGTLDNAKLTANGITVDPDAKSATPRVTFMD